MNTVPTTVPFATLHRKVTSEVFQTRRHALTEVLRGILCSDHPENPAHLSLLSDRSYGSLYQGIEEGRIDRHAMLAAGVELCQDLPPVFIGDATTWPHPKSPTLEDRGMQHTPGPAWRQSVPIAGHKHTVLAQATGARDSWCVPLLVDRVRTNQHPVEVVVSQITEVLAERSRQGIKGRAALLLDAGHPITRTTYLVREAHLALDLLIRMSVGQVVYRDAEDPPPGMRRTRGKPVVHAQEIRTRVLEVTPDVSLSVPHERFGTITIEGYTHVHPKTTSKALGLPARSKLPVLSGTLLVVRVARLREGGRPSTLFLWWTGDPRRLDLVHLVELYLHRYDIEHLFRFMKHHQGLLSYHPGSIQATETWFALQLLAYQHLFAARQVACALLPWERKRKSSTPYRVRRGVSALLLALFPRAGEAKTHPGGPGRPKLPLQRRRKRRTRYPVVRKARTKGRARAAAAA